MQVKIKVCKVDNVKQSSDDEQCGPLRNIFQEDQIISLNRMEMPKDRYLAE
jgi:hypothetical protein